MSKELLRYVSLLPQPRMKPVPLLISFASRRLNVSFRQACMI